MKKFLTMLSLVLLGFASTSCYDDSKLWDSVNDLDARVETLENLCTQMNSNLTALTELINAMTMGDVIIGVTPVKENGVEVGYQLLLKDGGIVTIYHGKNGKDGADGADGADGKDGVDGTNGTNGQDAVAPEFGVKQDTDGVYYWTLNGEFVVDAEGNKVPVTGPAGADGTNGTDGTNGADGAAGVTPQLKIENEKWFVSYDEGKTWEELGAATNVTFGACMFKDVELTETALILTLADGETISVPIGNGFKVVLGEFDATALQYGSDLEIPYTIEGAEGEVVVFLLREGEGFAVELVEETATSGKVTVSQLEATATEKKLKVGIFASGEDGTTVSKSVRLVSGVFAPVGDNQETSYAVEPAGGKVEFKVATNTAFEVKIEEGCDWITYVPQTKAVEEVALTFEVAANSGEARTAQVKVVSGNIELSFTISQEAPVPFEPVVMVYKLKKIMVYGGSWPQYAGQGGWLDVWNKTWYFDQTTGHGIKAEFDNYFEITVTSLEGAIASGTCTNWAGKDGKNWDCWFYNSKGNDGTDRLPEGNKDASEFYRQIPIGQSTWVRDYSSNTMTFTDSEGKQTVLKVYEDATAFTPGYDDVNATANTRYFPGCYKAGATPDASIVFTLHATVKGENIPAEYKTKTEIDKIYYNPRDIFFDFEKVESVPEEAKTSEPKWTPTFPEPEEPETPAAPATLAGTYKYNSDATVGGKDGSITVKGLIEQYQGWDPMKASILSLKNDEYTFTATGTDANGNETGEVTFNDGGDGTWDYQVWPSATEKYDATELYAFIGDKSTYVYDAKAGTITFTTRGKEYVVDFLLPGTYTYSTKSVTVPSSSAFGMHYDMGYTESRVPGFTNISGGAARHYVWARDYVLFLAKK